MDAFERFKDESSIGLFFEVGTGKTAGAVTLLRYKYKNVFKEVVPTLILCPPIVVKNWSKEIKMHSNIEDKDICELLGPQKKRVETIKKSKASIFITNYEALLMTDLFNEFKNKNFRILVLDELHKLKSIQAKRTKQAIELADRSLVRIGLTGTPVLNTPMDLFSQFRALDKGETFGKNFFTFRARYFYDKNQYMPTNSHFPDWRPKPGILEEFNKLVSKKSMHVRKADCLDLPPLVKKKVYFDMSPEQTRAYKEMSKDLITFFGQQAVSAQIALTKFLRLQQITTGFVTDDDGNIIKLTNPRSKVLQDLLEDLTPNHKVIVWAVFKENYEEIRKVCNLLGVKFVEVHGEVSEKARYENVDSFNGDESVRVLIGHPGSGGIGINLIASDVSIFYSRNFSLEQDIQAEARNYRGGSERHAKVTRIDLVCSDSIDEDVCEALDKKVSIGEAILRKWNIDG